MSGRPISPSDLIAALSLAVDVQRNCSLYHGWRVALVAHAMALGLSPKERADIFYAGLLHDVGSVGAGHHITRYPQLPQQLADQQIRAHPDKGASVARCMPGTGGAAAIIASHHEWWDGSGYPDGISGDHIPLGAQYLRIADSADLGRCFCADGDLKQSLRLMNPRTSQEWSRESWVAFLQILTNGTLPRGVMSVGELYRLVSETLRGLPQPVEFEKGETLETVFAVFGRVIDSKHVTCLGHSERVADWAATIGESIGLPEEEIRLLRWCGYVHDAGRLAVPKSVLDKSDRLTKDEIELIRSHALLTSEIFSTFTDCPKMQEIASIAGRHHERYDGLGYPDGLAGGAIPKLARILAVADAYDAMTSVRPHRQAMAPGLAIQRLQMNAKTQFDPEVVDAVVDLYNNNQNRFLVA